MFFNTQALLLVITVRNFKVVKTAVQLVRLVIIIALQSARTYSPFAFGCKTYLGANLEIANSIWFIYFLSK